MVIKNNTTGDTIPFPKTLYWNSWKSGITYSNNGSVTNSADSSNYRTASMLFYNDNNPKIQL